MGKVTWRTGRDVLHFASPSDAAKYRIETASVSVSDDIRMLLSRIEALEKCLSTVAGDGSRPRHCRPRSSAHGLSGIAPIDLPDTSSIELKSCSWSDTSCIPDLPDLPEMDLTGGDTTAGDTDDCSKGIDSMHKLTRPGGTDTVHKLPRSHSQSVCDANDEPTPGRQPSPYAGNDTVHKLPLTPRQSVSGTQDECSNGIDTMHSTLSPPVCGTQHECSNGIDTMHSTLSQSVCGTQDECSNGIDTMHITLSPSVCGAQDEFSNGIDTMHSTFSQSVCGTQDECSYGIDTMHITRSQSVCGTQDECPNGIDTMHVPQRPKGTDTMHTDPAPSGIDSTTGPSTDGTTSPDFSDPEVLRRCAAAQTMLALSGWKMDAGKS
jgi:hypothetical protein